LSEFLFLGCWLFDRINTTVARSICQLIPVWPVKIYEVMSGNCGSGRSREYISRSYRRVRYRLVGYGSSALTIEKDGIHKENPTLIPKPFSRLS